VKPDRKGGAMGRRVYVGKVSKFEDGEITAVDVEGQRIAVARVGEEVFALEDVCTHRQCALSEGLVEEKTVICPCHGAEFDLETGEALALPAKEPIQLFPTQIEGDDLYAMI
jgi:3-phenylpropionate/trans-cinnamate dioxygenase ferredoxin component